MHFLGGGTGLSLLTAKKGKQKRNKKLKIWRVQGQVRWPFGPPHLTLKPSKKKNENKEGLGKNKKKQRKQKQ